MKIFILALTALWSFSVFTNELPRAKAKAALTLLRTHRIQISRAMPNEVDKGADVSYACLGLQYKQWGDLIYKSIITDPNTKNLSDISDYLNSVDAIEKSFRINSIGRGEDFIKIVKDNYALFQQNKKFPLIPENLNYTNFADEEKNYIEALNDCGDQEYLDTTLAKLATVDNAKMINGAFVATASQITIGYQNQASSNGGIITGAICNDNCGTSAIVIDITAKTSIFNCVQSYADWIDTFLNM